MKKLVNLLRDKKLIFRCLSFVTLFLNATSYVHLQTTDFEGKISLELTGVKENFVKYEEIWLNLTVKNLTDEDVAVPEPTRRGGLDVHLIDQKGNIVPYLFENEGYTDNLSIIPANGIQEEFLEIGAYRNEMEPYRSIGAIALVPGHYKVYVVLGKMESNVYEFEVTQPPTQEREIYQRIVNKIIDGKEEESINEAKALMKEFPKSVYYPNIYIWFVTKCMFSKKPERYADEIIATSRDYINKYTSNGSTHGSVLGAMVDYIKGMKLKLGNQFNQKLSQAQWDSISSLISNFQNKSSFERAKALWKKSFDIMRNHDKELRENGTGGEWKKQ